MFLSFWNGSLFLGDTLVFRGWGLGSPSLNMFLSMWSCAWLLLGDMWIFEGVHLSCWLDLVKSPIWGSETWRPRVYLHLREAIDRGWHDFVHCDEGTLRSSGFVDPKDDTVCFRSWDGETRQKWGGNIPSKGGNQEIWEFFFLQKGIKMGGTPCLIVFFLFGGGGKKREWTTSQYLY